MQCNFRTFFQAIFGSIAVLYGELSNLISNERNADDQSISNAELLSLKKYVIRSLPGSALEHMIV